MIRTRQPGDGQRLGDYVDPERYQFPDADGLADWFEESLARPTGEDKFARVADISGQVVGGGGSTG